MRWALNAAAFLVKGDKVDAILEAIDRNRSDPDILGAGVAALAASNDEDRLRELLEARGLPLEGATLLAAAQKLPHLGVNLVANRIDIDKATVPELRLASVLVGIEKAPENLFDANHANSAVIGALNSHPDAIVAQYSIWATMENKHLGLAHVRIPLADVRAQRANIRAYIYRLLASDVTAARVNFDFLEEASTDEDDDARASLARGLRDTFFDGIDELVVSWILDEPHAATREYLLEHMAAQNVHMSRYVDFVNQAYKAAGAGSTLRARLESAAKNTPLATDLGRIRFLGDSGDFLSLGGTTMNNNSFTFNGPATGAFSGSGSASTHDINAINQLESPKAASVELGKLIDLLDTDNSVDQQVKKEVRRAAEAPTKEAVRNILDWFKVAREGGQLAASTIAAAPAIVDKLHHLLRFLPG